MKKLIRIVALAAVLASAATRARPVYPCGRSP